MYESDTQLASSRCYNHQQPVTCDVSMLVIKAAVVTAGKSVREKGDRRSEGAVATAGSESLREFFAFPPVFIHLRALGYRQTDDKSGPCFRRLAEW